MSGVSTPPADAPLGVRFVEDAVVNPTIRVASRPGELLMGVRDASGAYVEGTALERRSGEQGAPVPPGLFPAPVEAAEPEAVYAGTLYFHFGHFLLESLARAWYAVGHPELPLVWAGQHDWQDAGLRPWQSEVLDVLGLPNPVRVVTDPTRYPRLHVPDVGYRYDDRFHPQHAAFLGRYAGPAQEPGRRLWLSRSGIGTDVRDLGAAALERRLAAAGWVVRHPEALGVREQLDELCRAEVVAGEEGSAFHTLVLLRDLGTKRFHILRRRGPEHRNLHTVGAARGVDQTFHTLRQPVLLRAQGREVSKLSPSSAEVLDVLDVALPDPGSSARGADVDRVLAETIAALAPARLIQVGGRSAALVLTSEATSRVVVSTALDADPRVLARSGLAVHELGLEPYADVFHRDAPAFDVVHLAAPTFEEVMADFRTSLRLAGPRTTWLLGTGPLAARCAVAVAVVHPGYAGKRCLVRGRAVHVAVRAVGEPRDDAAVAALDDAEVRRRARRLRPLSLRRLRWRRRRGRTG